MDALDIVSLEQAKNWLGGIEFDSDDEAIERLIKSAISWVESYTCYRLYQREEEIITNRRRETVLIYPFSISSVKNSDNNDIVYQLNQISSLRSVVCLSEYCGTATITANVGYDNVSSIPGPLIEAAYKILTYLYENRDIYEFKLPSDIQFLLNPFRRALI